MRKKPRRAVLFLVLLWAACFVVAGCRPPTPPAPTKKVTVGNKNFTEQRIIGQMMKQALEARGFKVNLVSDLSTMALRKGMETGDIDVCADYTGTAWMQHLGHTYEPGTDNNQLYGLVSKEEAGKGFIWLDPIWNNNTYALASWATFAEAHAVETLSDLAALYRKNEGKIKTFVNFEVSVRPDGLPALEELYGFKVDEAFLMTGAPGASMKGLELRECEVAMLFGTDSLIAKYGWHVYRDERTFFPPYDLTPYVRAEILDKHPEIADILNELVATFPGRGKRATHEIVAEGQKVWQALNADVDIKKMKADEVAREYLINHGLVK